MSFYKSDDEHARDLTDNEMASLEKIAVLKAVIGRLRRDISEAREQAAPGTVVESLLRYALEREVP